MLKDCLGGMHLPCVSNALFARLNDTNIFLRPQGCFFARILPIFFSAQLFRKILHFHFTKCAPSFHFSLKTLIFAHNKSHQQCPLSIFQLILFAQIPPSVLSCVGGIAGSCRALMIAAVSSSSMCYEVRPRDPHRTIIFLTGHVTQTGPR